MAEILNFSESGKATSDALSDLHEHFSDDLARVETEISSHMASAAELIPEIGDHIIGAGGKRLRPLLTLSAAALANYQGQHHVTLAAAVEYMHTATLLHDDVVDESDLRRGKPTARKVWGNQASVLVGDFLLGQAFRMMVAARSLESLDILSTAAAVIAEGEVITDSAAIITFLADRHGGLTFPAGSVQRAKQDALLHRVNDEIDAVLWTAARHSFILPEAERVPAVKESLKLEFARSLDRLMEQIDGPYLMGDTMTIPDIILVHCGGWAYNAKFPLENEAFKAYTKRLRERDAFKRAAALP